MAAANDAKKIYEQVVQDVCAAVREALSEEGYDEHTLHELQALWLGRLKTSKALEPVTTSAVDEATTRVNRRSTTVTNEVSHPTTATTVQFNNKPSIGARPISYHQTPISALSNLNPSLISTQSITTGNLTMPTQNSSATTFIRPTTTFNRTQNPTTIINNSMKTANQFDGANDEIITSKKSSSRRRGRQIEITFQLDGTGPRVTDDEDDDDDNDAEGNDDPADVDDDDDDDEANDEGKEDSDPLNSDDDVSDDEPAELFDTDNVVVCQYDKISRTKNKWRFALKSGVMNINGRDYIFSRASGDADW